MKVKVLSNPNIYSCLFYYIRGTWSTIPDVNTLIDVGTDDFVMEAIAPINGGVGKRKVDLVILTHEHFDHAGGLKYIINEYNPQVLSYKKLPGVTDITHDGMKVKIGDRIAEIIHTPGHSNDSICIYIPEEESIFVGDLAYNIKFIGGSYSKAYIEVLEKIASLKISKLYSGHDSPLFENVIETLNMTIENVKKSKLEK